MPSISYQLYSSRNWEAEETFKMLASLGINEVEGFGPYFDDPSKTRTLLDTYGMKMPTGHFATEMFENMPGKIIEIAKSLGIETLIAPYIPPEARPTTLVGWQEFAARMAKAAEPLVTADLQFAWHNHDFELLPIDGVMPLDLIADASDDIGLQLDLAWLQVAGQSPEDWLMKYSGRIVATHVKDIAPKGENTDEDGWADVGQGIMDWDKIMWALDAVGVPRYVIEHDNPNDHVRMATRSLAAVLAFCGKNQ